MECLKCKDREFNEETVKVLEEVCRGEGIVETKDVKSFFKKLKE